MIPLQQFKIYKFESGRLLESKGKISLTIDDARKNGEIVSMGDCQLIRFVRRMTGKIFSRAALDELLKKRETLSRAKNSKYTRTSISAINNEIDDFLFIRELVSVFFDNKKHYPKIETGIYINGEKYVPLMASAGMIRRNSVLYVLESIKDDLVDLLNNGRKKEIEIVPAKFTTYFALASSSSYSVSFPSIAVVPDKIIKTTRTVDYSTFIADGIDPVIEPREMEIECNAFDGQGLISPRLAKRWSDELELDYVFSTAIVRAAFLKGMVCVFDFHKFADDVADAINFKDIYGSHVDIRDVDCIISESMFKLWNAYEDTESYVRASKDNGFDFSISRVSPKEEKTHARSSYQFIQILNLESDDDIRVLCEPTISWINSISSGALTETLLYSLGDTEYSKGWFNRLPCHTRAILLNSSAAKDPYILLCEDKSISKKKNDAKMGRLLFSGNYSTLIADPFAQAAGLFGLDIYLLKDKTHYSHYWNNAGVKRVAAIRSPIVHSSEVNVFNFETGKEYTDWYGHIKTGTIIPANGIGMDCAILGGSD